MLNLRLSIHLLSLTLSLLLTACRPSVDDNGTNESASVELGDATVTPEKLSKAYLPLAGGTMAGTLNMGGKALTNLSAPSGSSDAATKGYADAYLAGLSISGVSSISNGQVLSWNSTTSQWEPSSVSGGAAATSIASGGKTVDSTATTTTPTSGHALVYDSAIAGKWGAGVVSVPGGGTGAATLTSNGMLYGNGTSAVQALSAMTNGQLVVGKTANPPQVVTMSGDATIDNTGAVTIANNAVTSAKVSATGGVSLYSVVSKTTTATLTAGETVVLADASGGAFTITMPTYASVGTGQVYTIKKIDTTSNAVTISRNTSGTIDGANTIALNGQYESVQLATNGTNWYRLGATSKVVNITTYTNSTRTPLVAAASLTLETIPVTKKSPTSYLLIQGTVTGYNSHSGSSNYAWKYGAGTEVVAQNLQYQDTTYGFAYPTTAIISGHTTTGAQNLVLRFYSVDGTANAPFVIYNPNATDDARLAQTQSVFTIWEIEP